MNRCDSAPELIIKPTIGPAFKPESKSWIAFDEVFHLLHHWLNEADLPRKPKERYLAWLDNEAVHTLPTLRHNFRVCSSFPSQPSDTEQNSLPNLWYWFIGNKGLLRELDHQQKFAAVVSSRQSYRSEDRRRWFRKFMHAAQAIDRDNNWWLLFPSIATGPLSEHVARRCQVRSVKCELLPWLSLLERLLQLCTSRIDVFQDYRQVQCWFTPFLHSDREPFTYKNANLLGMSTEWKNNLYDSLSIHLPQRLHVIDIREGGNMDQLITDRLRAYPERDPSVRIYRLLNEKATAQQKHLELGAIDWLMIEPTIAHTEPVIDNEPSDNAICNPIFTLHWPPDSFEPTIWPYLTHCTRARLFEWSDTTLSAEWDRWLFNGSPEESSPWETLLQIARAQRLVSSPQMTRDKVSTISFSAVPLLELLSRRTYRSHLRRWDWEPYGVCIHKAALAELPVREVIYGDEATWNHLSLEERPWFQPRFSRNGKLDWQEEKEWRLVGDLRLRKLPWETVFFFVPTLQEAQLLSRISSWPVAVVGQK